MNDTTYDSNKELLPLLYNSRLYDFSITLEVSHTKWSLDIFYVNYKTISLFI